MFFLMIPDGNDGPKGIGHGVAYQLSWGGEMKEMWKVDGWYSHEVFLSIDGHYLVRMGTWNFGQGVKPGDLAVAFYEDGRLLRSYSTADLVKDPTKVIVTSSHYFWLARDDRQGLARLSQAELSPRLDDDSRSFTLSTVDGVKYWFDIATGRITKTSLPGAVTDEWPSADDLERISIAVAIADYPIPLAKLDQLIGLKKYSELALMFRGNGVSQILALGRPDAAGGFPAVRIEMSGLDFTQGALEKAQVSNIVYIHVAADGGIFEFRPSAALANELPRLKEQMKKKGESPREASERAMKSFNGRFMFRN